ncbi:hypothetical protein P4S72_22450 [Vibrio sp. PP-XX7]
MDADVHDDIGVPQRARELLKTIRDGALFFSAYCGGIREVLSWGSQPPIESGALGVVGAIVLSILFSDLSLKILMRSGMQTAMLVSVAMWI